MIDVTLDPRSDLLFGAMGAFWRGAKDMSLEGEWLHRGHGMWAVKDRMWGLCGMDRDS